VGDVDVLAPLGFDQVVRLVASDRDKIGVEIAGSRS